VAGVAGRSSGQQVGHSSLLDSHRIAYWSQDHGEGGGMFNQTIFPYIGLEDSRELAIHIFA